MRILPGPYLYTWVESNDVDGHLLIGKKNDF